MSKVEVERKVTKVGNSLGITLPAEVLEHLNIKQGDKIIFHLEQGKVSFQKNHTAAMNILKEMDHEFLESMEELFYNYEDALRNLKIR